MSDDPGTDPLLGQRWELAVNQFSGSEDAEGESVGGRLGCTVSGAGLRVNEPLRRMPRPGDKDGDNNP
jgi:hypothetical protein